MDMELLKQLAAEHGKLLAKQIAIQVILPALDKAVLNSPNKIDDIVWAAMKAEALEEIEKL